MIGKPKKIKGRTLEVEMLEAIQETDGIEVHRDNWVIADRLVKAGKIKLSHQRGPGGNYKRATLKEADNEDD